jgi:hypothetical protein
MTRTRRFAASAAVTLAILATGAYTTKGSRSVEAEESRAQPRAELTAQATIERSAHMGPYAEPQDGSADFMQHVWNR